MASTPTLTPVNPAFFLALDSSTDLGSVAVGEQGRVLAEVVLRVKGGASAALMPAVDEAVRRAGVEREQLGAVVVAGGPGSFTGVRIAAATAKGITHALRLPLFAYSGLLMSAAGAWAAAGPVCALFDARRRDVYAACYRFGGGAGSGAVQTLLEPAAMSLDELYPRLRGLDAAPVLTGDGAWRHREELERELGARVLPDALGAPRASALLWLAHAAPALGRVEDADAWEPEYLRASGAERMAAARAATAGP